LSECSPLPVVDESGVRWPSATHLYLATKFRCDELKRDIRALDSFELLFSLGELYPDHHDPQWEERRAAVRKETIRLLCDQHVSVRLLLLKTGDRPIVNDNPYDRENVYGEALMEVRTELRQQLH
jgi:predicted NAD-dependent protein-ADP-ribosyltransferase YbiA (DUF1768 family)